MAWPPELALMKTDMGVPADDTRDDERLQITLDAAVRVVQRLREGDFDFTADPLSGLPDPDADLELGTVRLAWRYHVRRRSPDALIALAEMGSARVPSFDPDVEMLLGIGRHRGPVIAG